MKKLAIFVDVQNIYYTTKQAFKNQLNYRALWNLASSRGELINAYAYLNILESNAHFKNFVPAQKELSRTVNIALARFVRILKDER